MKLSRAHFIKDLESELGTIYSFFADESIQISELTDEVIKKAKSAGFEDKQTHIVTKDTDWSLSSNSIGDIIIILVWMSATSHFQIIISFISF